MADFDDELDINLRDPDDIGARIILLSALLVWPEINESEEQMAWQKWLDAQGILSVATDAELAIIDGLSGDHLTEAEADLCDRALDSVVVLAWATALYEEIPPLRLMTLDSNDLSERIPFPNEQIGPFLDQLLLQDEDAIAVERERSEIWNWRLAIEEIRRRDAGAERAEIDDAIREVVLESAISFAFTEIDAEDFLVEGVAVRTLEDEYLESLVVTSEERLRALNWLCGLTEWDHIHPPE
jgi:hypothetical protein